MNSRLRVPPKVNRRIIHPVGIKKTPYGLQVVDSCLVHPLLRERVFRDLPQKTVKRLDAISSSTTYPKGALLFREGQNPRGVFVLCNGRAKLSVGSSGGRVLILRIAEPGEVVGVPSTISGKPYEVTAEALEPIEANFIPRDPFLKFLRRHGEAAVRVAEILSDIYHATYQEVRYLGLSGSAAQKLARFLLDLTAELETDKNSGDGPAHLTVTLTHEEIADMIGSSRETVSRLFASFKRQGLLEVRGSMLVLTDKSALERLIEG